MIDEEIWKPVSGYEDLYSVSNLGRVRTNSTLHIKCQRFNSCGYLQVALNRNDRTKHHLTHKLVAIAFIGDRQVGMEINHRDGIKTNNFLNNLDYVTHSQNMRHAFDNGLMN